MKHIRAGIITGSPLCGLCHRECIQVTKVFDGCMSRISDQQIVTTISGAGVAPYVFISEESGGETVVSNLMVVPIGETKENAVSFDAIIPVTVTYSDATGAIYTASSSVTLHRDVVLKLPNSAIMPYSISVTSTLRSVIGTFISPTEISCRVCIMQICRVTSMVDMLVPSYGYAVFPGCHENGPCDGLKALPLFPPFD